MTVKVAPSILSADFSRLGEEVTALDSAGADYIHVDVMDGHFVPNITIGAGVVRSIRPFTDKPLDVHLMIDPVDSFIDPFVSAGADIITVHVEAGNHPDRTIQLIKDAGIKAGISLNPSTPPEAIAYLIDKVDIILVMSVNPGFGGQLFIESQLKKIEILKSMIGKFDIELEVDGGITEDTAKLCVARGANVLVAGSAIFFSDDYNNNIRKLRP